MHCGWACAHANAKVDFIACALQLLDWVRMIWPNAGAQPGTFNFMLDDSAFHSWTLCFTTSKKTSGLSQKPGSPHKLADH